MLRKTCACPKNSTRSRRRLDLNYQNKHTYLNSQFKDKLIKDKQYIDKNGQNMPEIRDWKWQATNI